MKTQTPNAAHVAYMNDLKAALAKHPHLDPLEMLGVTSQLVGNLLAHQDQTRWTVAQLLDMIGANIETGNRVAIETVLADTRGNA